MREEAADNCGLAGRIEVRLENYLERHPLGIVRHQIAFSFPGILDADREGVVPDLCFVPNDQLDNWDGDANVQQGAIPALTTPLLPGFSLEMPRIREALTLGRTRSKQATG